MSLGQRIRELRLTRGLTQTRLAGPELSKGFISLLEQDRTQPSVGTLRLIARRLAVSVDSLLGSEGRMPEAVTAGLLALSREAIRDRKFPTASKLLEAVKFMNATYGLNEASREAELQAGQIAMEQREFGQALARLQVVSEASGQAKDFWRLGRALVLVGWVKIRQREFPEAILLLEKALLTLRKAQAGRDPARTEALIALGTAQGYTGQFKAAIRAYEMAASSTAAKRSPVLRGRALWGIGLAHRKLGHYDAAKDNLLKAKNALESSEELPDMIRVLKNLGELLFEEGQVQEALRYLHRALRAMDRLGMDVARAATLTEIGRIHMSKGNLEDAEHFSQQALDAATKVGDPVEVAEAKLVLARVRILRKDAAAAIKLLKEAVDTFKDRRMRPKVAEAARELGLLLRDRGAHAQAAKYLALAIEETPSTSKSPSLIGGQP